MRLGIIRLKLQRFFVLTNSVIKTTNLRQGSPQIVMGLRVIRFDPQRLFPIPYGFFRLAGLEEGFAQSIVKLADNRG